MMIKIRYFAALREQLGCDQQQIPANGVETVADVWAQVSGGKPLPEQLLCSINMEYANRTSPVKSGDEVAFFPPVTGG